MNRYALYTASGSLAFTAKGVSPQDIAASFKGYATVIVRIDTGEAWKILDHRRLLPLNREVEIA